jgi:outer membrane protein assembly factor BamB
MNERHETLIYVNPAKCYGGARLLLQLSSGLPTISELEVEVGGKVADSVAVIDDRTILCFAPDDEPGAKDVVVMSGKREIIRQEVAVEHSGESRSGEAKPESRAELDADTSSSLEKPGDPTRPASNWWMLHQDLEHSGNAGADTVVPLQKLWEQTFQDALFTSQPIVGDGAVLVGILGNGDESFAALDEETGQRRWVHGSERAVTSGNPVAVNGLVYFIESDLSGSELICLRIADGSMVWSKPLTHGSYQGALAAAFGYIYSLSRFGTLAAYTASTGTLAWQASVDVGYGTTLSSPAIGLGNVYVGTAQGLRAFDAITGAPKWAASGSPSNGNATPLIVYDVGIDNPAVVAIGTSDQTLRGYHATNGSLLWEFVGDMPLYWTTPATDSGKIYLRQSRTIVELDAIDGTVTATSPDLGADVVSAPAMTKSRLITITSDDRIVALNRPGLNVDAELGIPGHPMRDWGPSVEGGHLYVNVAASDPWPAPRDTVHAYRKRSNCFIATAAYGSPLAQEVVFLCDVRDNRLRKYYLGNLFVDAFQSVYYKFSPFIAEKMRRNPWFKVAMRWIVVAPVVRTLKVIATVAGLTGDLTKRKPQ